MKKLSILMVILLGLFVISFQIPDMPLDRGSYPTFNHFEQSTVEWGYIEQDGYEFVFQYEATTGPVANIISINASEDGDPVGVLGYTGELRLTLMGGYAFLGTIRSEHKTHVFDEWYNLMPY